MDERDIHNRVPREDEGISVRHALGHKIIEVNTRRARYQGTPYCNLDGWRRRKYDNWTFLRNPICRSYCGRCLEREPIKILYL